MIVVLFHQSDEGDTTMAEGNSMTAREAASNVMAVEHADVLRESVAVMVREIMEVEIAQLAGAELGERVPDRRLAQRNGYRDRLWDTRVGEIELQIPRLRSGSYLPSFLEPRRRAEQALVAVVQEAYCQRRLHAQGRPPGRADGTARPLQGPGLAHVPLAG
jgi:transposase-like protein